jgi:Leucine-rich repeat (LRR) protein
MLPSELEELIEQAAREEWEELDLAGKGIEVLPATIAKCRSLKKLILGKITERKYHDIYIGWTTEYKIYKKFGNLLKTLPPEIAELINLQSLDLSYNSISEIPDSITRLTNLQHLDLSYNGCDQNLM